MRRFLHSMAGAFVASVMIMSSVAYAAPTPPSPAAATSQTPQSTPTPVVTPTAKPAPSPAAPEQKKNVIPVTSNDAPIAALFDENKNPILYIKRGKVLGPHDFTKVCTILGDALKNNPQAFTMVGLVQTVINDHGAECTLPEVELPQLERPVDQQAPASPAPVKK